MMIIRNLWKRFSTFQRYLNVRQYSTPREQNGTAIVIGGGPCGTTTSLALSREGVECHVYEKAPRDVASAGGSLSIHGGGVCLQYLGIEQQYKNISNEIDKIIYTTIKGEHLYTLTQKELKQAIENHENSNSKNSNLNLGLIRGVLRADLYSMLQNECDNPTNNVYLNTHKSFERYEKLANGKVKAWFQDGSSIIGDILLGCDGINSPVRNQFIDEMGINTNIYNPYEYSGFSAWWVTGNLTDIKQDLLTSDYMTADMKESAIKGNTFVLNFEYNDSSMALFNIIPKANTYIFVLAINNNNAKHRVNPSDNCIFNDWESKILQHKESDRIHDFIHKYDFNPFFHQCTQENQRTIDFYTVQMTNTQKKIRIPWHDDKILLLGDAAHGVTPFGGQGCNHAIYDAVALAHIYKTKKTDLTNSADTHEWFDEFYRSRSILTDAMIQNSLKLGAMSQCPLEMRAQMNQVIKSGNMANLMVKQWIPQLGSACHHLNLNSKHY